MIEPNSKKIWQWTSVFAAGDIVFVSILRYVFAREKYGIIGVAFYMAILMLVQLVAGFIIHAMENQKLYGKALLLATAIILMIGFGICTLNR
ncbi:MAG: hypothetical protein V4722_05045 [Bacteroidota bacterium]